MITGKPGVSKTTAIGTTLERVTKKAGGFFTEETRVGHKREGVRTRQGKIRAFSTFLPPSGPCICPNVCYNSKRPTKVKADSNPIRSNQIVEVAGGCCVVEGRYASQGSCDRCTAMDRTYGFRCLGHFGLLGRLKCAISTN